MFGSQDIRNSDGTNSKKKLRFVVFDLSIGMFGDQSKGSFVRSLQEKLAAAVEVPPSKIILEIIKNNSAIVLFEGLPANKLDDLLDNPLRDIGGHLCNVIRYRKPMICWRCGVIGQCDKGTTGDRRCIRCASRQHDVRNKEMRNGVAKGCDAKRAKCFRCMRLNGQRGHAEHRADDRHCPVLIEMLRNNPERLFPEAIEN